MPSSQETNSEYFYTTQQVIDAQNDPNNPQRQQHVRVMRCKSESLRLNRS